MVSDRWSLSSPGTEFLFRDNRLAEESAFQSMIRIYQLSLAPVSARVTDDIKRAGIDKKR